MNRREQPIIVLSCSPKKDSVLVARAPIKEGEIIQINGVMVRVATSLNIGHKLACRALSSGDKVLKYGVPIGTATSNIRPGDHVHLHNLKSDYTTTYTLQPDTTHHGTKEQGASA